MSTRQRAETHSQALSAETMRARDLWGDAMRFFCFHLMPWAHLPEDFAEHYDSAWVTCPNTLYDPQLGHPLYNRYLDELELADQLGFEGICVNEHQQNAYGKMTSPNIMRSEGRR